MGEKINVNGVEEKYDISKSRIHKATHFRELNYCKIFGRIVFDEDDVIAWVEAHTVNIKAKKDLEMEAMRIIDKS